MKLHKYLAIIFLVISGWFTVSYFEHPVAKNPWDFGPDITAGLAIIFGIIALIFAGAFATDILRKIESTAPPSPNSKTYKTIAIVVGVAFIGLILFGVGLM